MKMPMLALAGLLLTVPAHAGQVATGKHIAKATLVTRTGAPVATADADAAGRIRFSNVPNGEYKLVLTSPDGQSVTVADLDGDGMSDLVVSSSSSSASSGSAASSSTARGGGGAGKVSMQDLHVSRAAADASSPSSVDKSSPKLADAAVSSSSASSVSSSPAGSSSVVSPRDAASGLPTGKRMHTPIHVLVDWSSGQVQGRYASETAMKSASSRMPASPSGRCGVRVDVETQPGTIEVMSWSWGETQTGAMSSR